MNYLVAEYAGIASNCELALGLQKHIDLQIIYERKDPYGLDSIVKAQYGTPKMPFAPLPWNGGDVLIIVSTPTFKRLIQRRGEKFLKKFKRVLIIISDGWYMWEYGTGRHVWREFNDWFTRLGVEVWVTHDKLQFRKGLPTKEFYQPFDFSGFEIEKNKELTVSHSPFKSRNITKGTDDIVKTVSKFNIKFDLIQGVSWKECMNRKSKSHVFIDQIKSDKKVHNDLGWIGGIGKSGFEAMGLDNVLICRGKYKGLEIPEPPVCWIEDMALGKWIQYMISNEDKMIDFAYAQNQWFKKYCSRDYQAKRILNAI